MDVPVVNTHFCIIIRTIRVETENIKYPGLDVRFTNLPVAVYQVMYPY